jgi:glycosyltransferase involved in cell wall biosynthesis
LLSDVSPSLDWLRVHFSNKKIGGLQPNIGNSIVVMWSILRFSTPAGQTHPSKCAPSRRRQRPPLQIQSGDLSTRPTLSIDISSTCTVDELPMNGSITKVVVLMATFNGANHLADQLLSLGNQTHENWELIVSDDGSVDATLDIVRTFATSVRQSVVTIEGPREGFWQNFLSLLRHTTEGGDLFAFSDQDDIWFHDKLERAVRWFAKQPPDIPALYFSRTEIMSEDGAIIGLSPLFRRPTSFQNALVQSIGGGNTMVLNRAAKSLLVSAPNDIVLPSHDWWAYQVVTGAGGRAFYDPLPSLFYRQHTGNLVGSNQGIKARLSRLAAFTGGRARRWNDININSLYRMRNILSEDAVRTLNLFSKARTARLPKKMLLLWQSGVYRQGRLESIGLHVGAWFGRI